MQALAGFIMLLAIPVTWWLFARHGRKNGWGALKRHAGGALAGLVGMFVVAVALMPFIPAAPEHAAEAAQLPGETNKSVEVPVVAQQARAVEQAQPQDGDGDDNRKGAEAAAAAPPVDMGKLAQETVRFLTQAEETVGFAIQARDAAAVRDQIDMPSWQLIKRWNDAGYAAFGKYEDCYEALQSMNSFSTQLIREDSADRRRSLDYNGKRFEKYFPKCKEAAGEGA